MVTRRRYNTKHHRDDDGRECTRCHEYKGWDQFYKRTGGGHFGQCVACVAEIREAKKDTAA